MIRTFLIAVAAIVAIAVTGSPTPVQAMQAAQAKKSTAPKTEKELRKIVDKSGYVTEQFSISHFEQGRYAVLVPERQQAEGKKAALAFFKSLKIPATKISWDIDYDLGSEGQTRSSKVIMMLPYKTKSFRIDYDNYHSRVVVVPLVDIDGDKNPIKELERVWPTYERYTKEAFAWLNRYGFSTEEADLEVWMEDFWPKGKTLKYQNPKSK